MRLTHFFIDRPRFATVLSVFVTLFGLGALAILPVAQYPEIVPPTVKVTASYPGASHFHPCCSTKTIRCWRNHISLTRRKSQPFQ